MAEKSVFEENCKNCVEEGRANLGGKMIDQGSRKPITQGSENLEGKVGQKLVDNSEEKEPRASSGADSNGY